MKLAKTSATETTPVNAINDECNQTDFERRLVRLWRCGFLPSKICQILGVSASHMSSELDRLASLKVDLTFDSTREALFDKPSYRSKVKHLPYSIVQIVQLDTLFFYSEGLKSAEIGRLVQRNIAHVNETLLMGRSLNSSVLSPKTPGQIAARNAAAVSDFIANEKLKNVNTLISKKYGISRKMLDLILENAGHSKTKKRTAPAQKTDPKIHKTHQQIVNNYMEGEQAKVPRLISKLALKFRYSETHIRNILKKANVL